MTNEAISMRKLRQWRRIQGVCAQCGEHRSERYLCMRCEERRNKNRQGIEEQRAKMGQCIKCGRTLQGRETCEHCFKKYPLRKLKRWQIGNERLYQAIEASKISIPELAQALNLKTRTVERWVFEGITPKRENADKVARYFNQSVSRFFRDYTEL